MLKPASDGRFRTMCARKKRSDEEDFQEQPIALASGGCSGGSGCGSGSGSGSRGGGFSPGQNLSCKVISKEPGGYSVSVGKQRLQGFLPTQSELEIETDVIATYVCQHNGRMLMSARFSTKID
jgi:hypothetical protein